MHVILRASTSTDAMNINWTQHVVILYLLVFFYIVIKGAIEQPALCRGLLAFVISIYLCKEDFIRCISFAQNFLYVRVILLSMMYTRYFPGVRLDAL